MKEIDKIALDLFEKIRSRFDSVNLGDENAKATRDPQNARFFNFEYVVSPENTGNVTISIINNESLRVYYGTDISDPLSENPEERTKWYDFLKSLRHFARRNMLGFDTRDIAKSNLELKDIKQQSSADSTMDSDELKITESRKYGTSRNSFEDVGNCRLRIVHSESIDENQRGARTRKIDAVFVETPRGERFRMDHNNLSGAAALAMHLSHDGEHGDEICEAINGMCAEMASMTHFVRSVKRRQFEDSETDQMAQSAINRYYELKNQLKRLRSPKHYLDFVENFMPETAAEDEYDVNSLRERFVKKLYDERFDQALPYVYRAHRKQEEAMNNPMAEEFEDWADSMLEGTWAVPERESEVDALRKLMGQPFKVGINGVDATSELYDVIGSDELFDEIQQLAEIKGPDYDCRPEIIKWLIQHFPSIGKEMEQLYTQSMEPEQAQPGTEPVLGSPQPAEQQAAQPVQQPQQPQPQAESVDPLNFIRTLAGLRK